LRVGRELAVIELRDIGVAPSGIRRYVKPAIRATGRPLTFVRKGRNRRSEIPHHSALLPYLLVFRYSRCPKNGRSRDRCAAASESGVRAMAKVIIQYVREATEDVIAHHREAIEEHGMRVLGDPEIELMPRRTSSTSTTPRRSTV
jgi:hypothetical protein